MESQPRKIPKDMKVELPKERTEYVDEKQRSVG